ncbi:YqgE/AlgH family protein [Parafilimonas sp.]|uniref:YqgE/AlgH family protein n=1 Tax=Parafilimonas sp. TaxID=1969739 RepID=UPI0039E3B20E
MERLAPGTILIADPFLKDPNFLRTTIFLCEHKAEGSFGFVLNRRLDYVIGDLINDLEGCSFPVYYGGPVQQDTVHFLHRCPGLINGSEKVAGDIFWGGEFDELVAMLQKGKLSTNDIRLFLGYSGWGEGQLQNEMNGKTWLATSGSPELVFDTDVHAAWKKALKQLGGGYEQLINYPIDPQLN